MALNGDDGRLSRRRGAALEEAILEAAWEQLMAGGYGNFGFEAVAERARTSKPVLYRRWRTREELLLAAVERHGQSVPLIVPDTGNLRGDVIAVLTSANDDHSGMAGLLSARLGAYFDEPGASLAELRRALIGGRPTRMDVIVERAVERGEIDPAKVTARVATVPFDLFRNEALMTLRPVPDDVIREIVDEVFLPLVGWTA